LRSKNNEKISKEIAGCLIKTANAKLLGLAFPDFLFSNEK